MFKEKKIELSINPLLVPILISGIVGQVNIFNVFGGSVWKLSRVEDLRHNKSLHIFCRYEKVSVERMMSVDACTHLETRLIIKTTWKKEEKPQNIKTNNFLVSTCFSTAPLLWNTNIWHQQEDSKRQSWKSTCSELLFVPASTSDGKTFICAIEQFTIHQLFSTFFTLICSVFSTPPNCQMSLSCLRCSPARRLPGILSNASNVSWCLFFHVKQKNAVLCSRQISPLDYEV